MIFVIQWISSSPIKQYRVTIIFFISSIYHFKSKWTTSFNMINFAFFLFQNRHLVEPVKIVSRGIDDYLCAIFCLHYSEIEKKKNSDIKSKKRTKITWFLFDLNSIYASQYFIFHVPFSHALKLLYFVVVVIVKMKRLKSDDISSVKIKLFDSSNSHWAKHCEINQSRNNISSCKIFFAHWFSISFQLFGSFNNPISKNVEEFYKNSCSSREL